MVAAFARSWAFRGTRNPIHLPDEPDGDTLGIYFVNVPRCSTASASTTPWSADFIFLMTQSHANSTGVKTAVSDVGREGRGAQRLIRPMRGTMYRCRLAHSVLLPGRLCPVRKQDAFRLPTEGDSCLNIVGHECCRCCRIDGASPPRLAIARGRLMTA